MSEFQAKPDVAAEIARWLSYLGNERRMSAKTLESYRRDVSQFLAFLTDHLGGAPSLKQLARLTPADVLARGDWAQVTALAQQASQLQRHAG